jgi:putative FmdB family regulatory protein
VSPTYAYYCESCKETTEEFFSMSSKPDHITCKCGKQAKSQINNGNGFLLKGHGWGFDRYAGPSNFSNSGKDDNE